MRSSKPSPVEPNSKKELELAKQLQKENHYKGFTSEDENTTCENPDDYLKELDEKVKSMIAKSEKKMRVGRKTSHSVCVCKVCGKKGQWVTIRDHIEAKHLYSVFNSCNQCEKTFRSITTFRTHKKLYHKKSQSGYFSLCDKIVVEKS